MTSLELKNLEAELIKRGYKKWTTCLVGREDYAWFKSFNEHKDNDGDTTCDYQIAFRIYDFRSRYDTFSQSERSGIWVTVTMVPTNLDNRLDCDYSLRVDVPDVETCEKMMAEFYVVAKKYINER